VVGSERGKIRGERRREIEGRSASFIGSSCPKYIGLQKEGELFRGV